MTSFIAHGIIDWMAPTLIGMGRLLTFVTDHSNNIMMMLSSVVFIENAAIFCWLMRVVLCFKEGWFIYVHTRGLSAGVSPGKYPVCKHVGMWEIDLKVVI